ncbi:MAG: glutamate-1-semialdehyde 2,1-aminomutase [Bacteroidales bacterium]|nr:glutamate-1-semialdehyde 2,1-aminomutase [Bacteroidales bacterium]
MIRNKSIQEFERAQSRIPGGVNSPVRAFKSVGLPPVLIDHAKGSRIYDIDGNEYIDYVSTWGPAILGHAREEIVEAIKKAAEKGTSFGAPTVMETEMAQLIIDMMPAVDMVRMVNSGTEATMSAIRLARAFTGRDMIIKFEGNYHGHADSFLIQAGSGAMTLGVPNSPGVTKATASETLTAPYNDLKAVETLFENYPNQIAAIIVEPVAANMGLVLPQPGFLEGLRKITADHNALLIFDEVITGFRLGAGGAQEYYNINPDLTTMGKIIGGGLPVGAYGGRKDIMEMLAPAGPVYQAGTLSGNPLAMAAGFTALKILKDHPEIYRTMAEKAIMLADGIRENIRSTGISAQITQLGSLMTLFFNDSKEITSFADAAKSDTKLYAAYFKEALENGIYLAPSQFECAFVSDAHTTEDIERTIAANKKALEILSTKN